MPPTQSRFKGLNARNKHSYTFLFQLINLLAFNKCASSYFLFKGHYWEYKGLAERTIKDHRILGTVERQVVPVATLENQSFMLNIDCRFVYQPKSIKIWCRSLTSVLSTSAVLEFSATEGCLALPVARAGAAAVPVWWVECKIWNYCNWTIPTGKGKAVAVLASLMIKGWT